jgi:hypothetical protein
VIDDVLAIGIEIVSGQEVLKDVPVSLETLDLVYDDWLGAVRTSGSVLIKLLGQSLKMFAI